LNGQDTDTYDSGDSYEGTWRDGKKHGYGTYIWSDERRYIGTWYDGKQHGYSTFTGVSRTPGRVTGSLANLQPHRSPRKHIINSLNDSEYQ